MFLYFFSLFFSQVATYAYCFNLINSSYLLFFTSKFAWMILRQRKFTMKKQNNGQSFKFSILLCKFLIFFIFSIFELFCVRFDFGF